MTADTLTSNTAHPRLGDAFGQLLLAAHAGGGLPTVAYEATERDDGLLTVRDAHHYFAPVPACDPVATLLGLATGRVLDIGCGAGRHLLHLKARPSITALGIDQSDGAAQVCARRGVDVVHGDIRQPSTIGMFDTLLMLGGNLGLLGTPDTARPLLTVLAGLAQPGARLIGEGFNATATSDPAHADYQAANVRPGRAPGQVTVRIRYQRWATAWTDLWFPSPGDLSAVAAGTCWIPDKISPVAGSASYHAVFIRTTS